jgi:hypothetical protein
MSNSVEQPTLILTLKSVEVSQQISEDTFPVASGPLSVLHFLQSNTFVIQANNFSYTLSKDHTISASPSNQGQLSPSYIFPADECSFIVKIIDCTSSEDISSFESILKNQSRLSYQEEQEPAKSELEQPLLEESDPENESLIPLETKLGSSSSEKPSNCVTKGGELTRKGLIWSAELLAGGIEKLGGFVEKKCTSKHEEKGVKSSIVEKLSTADSATQTALNFTKKQTKGLLGAGKRVGEKIMNSELGHKFEQSKYHDSVTTVGKSSLYAVACLYDGLIESISVIGKGIRDTTASAVSSRYGERVGDVTRKGFNVIGNIGNMVLVFQDEANEYIHEQNGTIPEKDRGNYQPIEEIPEEERGEYQPIGEIPEQNRGNLLETKLKSD